MEVGEGGEHTVGADGLGDLFQDVFLAGGIEQRPRETADHRCDPVNSISPGVIVTPMGRQELAGESEVLMNALVERSAAGRYGTSADIANAAAFLLGSDASFIAGTDLLVDGGAVAGSTRAID